MKFIQRNQIKLLLLVFLIFTLSFLSYSLTFANLDRKALLKNAHSWMYQIQDLERPGAISALSKTYYSMLVLEPTRTVKGSERFNTKAMIRKLRYRPDGKRRVILAYIDIGEAESYRTYWKKNWRAPSGGLPGYPTFIIRSDPDGWSGNYPVAYWDKRWKKIWTGEHGLIKSLAKNGFDGVYLDWVEAYDDNKVKIAAKKVGYDPAKQMIKFIRELKRAGRTIHNDFLVVSQNAPYLINKNKKYANLINALAVEDTWYRGKADVGWSNPRGGDIANRYSSKWSTKALLKQYNKYQQTGVPVFSVDYCLKNANARKTYSNAINSGLRPLVTRVSLSRKTTTPPPQEYF